MKEYQESNNDDGPAWKRKEILQYFQQHREEASSSQGESVQGM